MSLVLKNTIEKVRPERVQVGMGCLSLTTWEGQEDGRHFTGPRSLVRVFQKHNVQFSLL